MSTASLNPAICELSRGLGPAADGVVDVCLALGHRMEHRQTLFGPEECTVDVQLVRGTPQKKKKNSFVADQRDEREAEAEVPATDGGGSIHAKRTMVHAEESLPPVAR